MIKLKMEIKEKLIMSYNKINKVVFLKYLIITLGLTYIYLRFYAMGIESSISINGHAAVARHITYTVIIAPVIEEVIFRELLIKLLKLLTFLRPWAVVLISAILFGICHADVIQKLYAFALGVILAIIAQKYGTINYGIVIHMIVNLAGPACAFLHIYVTNAICIIVTVLSIIILKKDYKELFNIKSI
ncbi:MAG: lysostaphin resistance A-like protein [Lachnospiraceae bacterium]